MQPELRTLEVNGVKLRAAVAGGGPLIVLVHGFPELWYSWRHQIGPLAAAGYQVCALDVRGYGGSDKPQAVEAYDMESLTGDIAGVIAALSPDRPAVVVGHDWGAPLAWHTALLHPARVRAVAALSVPYTGLPPVPLIDIFRALYTAQGKFFYQIYFQDLGVAEAELEADVRGALRKLYYAASGESEQGWTAQDKPHGATLLDGLPDPAVFPAWMSDADMAVFVDAFRQGGFRGPLNRYRNFQRDHAYLSRLDDHRIYQPALFIAGERDLVLKMIPRADLIGAMERQVPKLRGVHILPGIGHWTQQEAPEAVSRLLVDFINALD